jgi:DNA-binding MarR family transcriptional regulator
MHLSTIEKLINLRSALDRSLYKGHALITYDLILEILQAHLAGKTLTIKELCAGSIRSTLNTRKHLNYLEKDGWIEFSNGIHDKRLRLVRANSKLIHLVDKLLEK